MSNRSIKNYVIRRLAEGATLELTWKEAREHYPHRCVGWGYILKLNRDLLRPPEPPK
jgi:hypothetical protein